MKFSLRLPLRAADARKYEPFDEVLNHPRIRMLRLLTRHDWLSACELKELLGALYDARVSNLYSAQLCRLARAGLVTTRPGLGHYAGGARMCDYAITDLGRRELPELLARVTETRSA